MKNKKPKTKNKKHKLKDLKIFAFLAMYF